MRGCSDACGHLPQKLWGMLLQPVQLQGCSGVLRSMAHLHDSLHGTHSTRTRQVWPQSGGVQVFCAQAQQPLCLTQICAWAML